MDTLSALIQEAKPLYLKRQHHRRCWTRAGIGMGVATLFLPLFLPMHHAEITPNTLNSLYADLYGETALLDTVSGTSAPWPTDEYGLIQVL